MGRGWRGKAGRGEERQGVECAGMSKVLEIAIEKARRLPARAQRRIADAMEHLAAEEARIAAMGPVRKLGFMRGAFEITGDRPRAVAIMERRLLTG